VIRLLRRLRRDRGGATIIEFALITPLLLTVILGFCEVAYQAYVQTVLTGAMQRAGRNSTIQGNETATANNAIDAIVIKRISSVAKIVSWKPTRKSYAQFGQIAPEPFEDNNTNSKYDAATECFTDVNGNKKWDVDPGTAGQGSANDVVFYQMDVTYQRLLPVSRLIGLGQQVPIVATTILKNQPWQNQSAFTPEKVCPKK
jgi:Flp pilus assembly pilin Flp